MAKKVKLNLREFLGIEKSLVIKHLKKVFRKAKEVLTDEALELLLKELEELKKSEKTGKVVDEVLDTIIEEVEEIKEKKKGSK